MMVQSFIERLRPLVWMKGWDYIVLWKLSDDHRSIELMDCCCGGAENVEDLGFEGYSSTLRCRDVMFPHQRVKSCELLDLVPSSMVLDSGVHAQALCSNQPSWLNYSHTSDSTLSQEAVGTRVLIPLTIGLFELFATKQVPEDEEVMDLIRIQSNIFVENQTMQKDEMSLFQQQRLDQLPNDITAERIHLSSHSNGMFLEGGGGGGGGPYDTAAGIFAPSSMESAFQEMSNASRGSSRWMEDDQMMHEDSFACDNNNRSDDSDPNEEDDDPRSRRRNGKGPQSKNLQAERNRRKKLNDRLYALRALVPNISKLDRASILGDAIEYVKELQKTADELKLELEQPSDDEESARKAASEGNENNIVQPPTVVHPNGTKRGPKRESENFGNGYHRGGSSCNNNNNMNISKQNHENELRKEKVQQMEPQVEVYQVDGNEFFVKVFCEYKFGGFVRIMEALNALGLEVANVNTTRHSCLASSIFKVERKNDENVEADDVKESLLELTRNPLGVWAMNGSGGEGEGEGEESESKNEMENDYGMNQHHSFHHYQH